MFLNPIMLAGLGAAVVPLVLHLLGRARHRSVDWGAMMFLAPADRRDRSSSRLRQYAMLAVRTLALACLAVALARPVASPSWAGLAPGGATTAVVILDGSASMSVVENGRSRMDAARDVAGRVLAGLAPGDRACLLLAGVPRAGDASDDAPGDASVAPDVDDATPTADLPTLAARVAAARPGEGLANVADELTRAARVLKRHAAGRDARVFVVVDRQAVGWRDVTPTFAADWRRQFDDPDAAGRITILPVGGDGAENVSVESVRLANPPAIVGERAEVEVRLRGHGPTPQPSVGVTLSRDGKRVAARSVAVPAGESAAARFDVTFDAAGSHLLTARAATQGFVADDRLDAAVDVTAPIRVLLVSGDEAAAGGAGAGGAAAGGARESTFFRAAAGPYAAAGRKGVDPAVVTVAPAERFDPGALEAVDVLVLANVAAVTPDQVRAIEQFVHEGGGLLVAPGALSDAAAYNAALYRDGAGPLPARLAPATPADGSAATVLLGVDLAHPAFAFLKGRPDPIPSATIGRYFPAVPRQPDAVVAGTYGSGRPFLVDARWGRGRVAVVTTPLDADWSTLPLSGFYVPFVQSLVRHLADAGEGDRSLRPGEPIIATIADAIDGPPSVQLPSGERATPAVLQAGGRTEVRFDGTAAPGLYRVRYREAGKDRVSHFVVRRPVEESDLTPLTPARWDELSATLRARRVDAVDGPADAALWAGPRRGRELWGPLLALTAGLLGLELWLGRRWSVGGGR